MGNLYNADASLAGPIPFLNLSEPSAQGLNVLNASKEVWAQKHNLSTELSTTIRKYPTLKLNGVGHNTGFCLVCGFKKVISLIQAFTGMLLHCKLLNQSKAVKYYPQIAILQLNRNINQHDCC